MPTQQGRQTCPRLLALDLDGTLLRSDGSISRRTRAAHMSAEERGLAVLSVTARPPRRVKQIAGATGLRGVAICSNGSLVYDLVSDLVLRQHRLDADTTAALVRSLRTALPGVAFAVEAGIDYGCEHGYAVQREHGREQHDRNMRRADALELCQEGVTKLIVQHPTQPLEALLSVARAHAGNSASVTHSGGNFAEIAAPNVSKAHALEACCQEHGITSEQVIAFGDMPNDLPMLRWAGLGIAVANAHPEVLAAADEVTRSNDADGVALVLERLFYM
jgi:Cof subfamily protein (haloacid dehalogenase superfamily)